MFLRHSPSSTANERNFLLNKRRLTFGVLVPGLCVLMLTLLSTFQTAHAATSRITEYPIPTRNSNPVDITTGPDGNLWFTEAAANRIGKITTRENLRGIPFLLARADLMASRLDLMAISGSPSLLPTRSPRSLPAARSPNTTFPLLIALPLTSPSGLTVISGSPSEPRIRSPRSLPAAKSPNTPFPLPVALLKTSRLDLTVISGLQSSDQAGSVRSPHKGKLPNMLFLNPIACLWESPLGLMVISGSPR